jgi:tripartite-type tricarboxylate transporter receptor subunit TctC
MIRFVIALAALLLAGVATASGQTYPQRPVRFILQFGPGAGVDITARMLAERLSARWGKAVVVENRPGGDGLVAINASPAPMTTTRCCSFPHRPSRRIPIRMRSCPMTPSATLCRS